VYSRLEAIISAQRLGSYLEPVAFKPERALALYAWNMKIGAAFFPLFCALEISLRNLIVTRMTAVYGASWWTDAGFFDALGKKGKGIVLRAANSVEQQGHVLNSGRITAELSFGFWENMLLPKYADGLWTPLHPYFPDLPNTVDQAGLFARIGETRTLRNRISHHEPIFQRDISKDYARTLELIRWLSDVKATWIKPHCDVAALLRRKP